MLSCRCGDTFSARDGWEVFRGNGSDVEGSSWSIWCLTLLTSWSDGFMENFALPDSVAQTNICPSKPAVATCAQQAGAKGKSARVVAPFLSFHIIITQSAPFGKEHTVQQ